MLRWELGSRCTVRFTSPRQDSSLACRCLDTEAASMCHVDTFVLEEARARGAFQHWGDSG